LKKKLEDKALLTAPSKRRKQKALDADIVTTSEEDFKSEEAKALSPAAISSFEENNCPLEKKERPKRASKKKVQKQQDYLELKYQGILLGKIPLF